MDNQEYNDWFRNLKKGDLVAVEIEKDKRYFIRDIGEVYDSPNWGIFEVFVGGDHVLGDKYVDGKRVYPEHPWAEWIIVPITESNIDLVEDFDMYRHLSHISFSRLESSQLQEIYKVLIKSDGLKY